MPEARLVKLFTTFLFVFLAAPLNVHGGQFPKEVYSANTVFVSCWTAWHNECKNESAAKNIQKILEDRKRWAVVTDPAQADLILVWFNSSESSTYGGSVVIHSTRWFGGLVVLKGGATPDWNTTPLFTTVGGWPDEVLREFYDDVIRTAPGGL